MSPVNKPIAKAVLIVAVAVVEEATSNFSDSSISWSVYSDDEEPSSPISNSSVVSARALSSISVRLFFSSTLTIVPSGMSIWANDIVIR